MPYQNLSGTEWVQVEASELAAGDEVLVAATTQEGDPMHDWPWLIRATVLAVVAGGGNGRLYVLLQNTAPQGDYLERVYRDPAMRVWRWEGMGGDDA
jgi:hypothetical protein